MYIEKQNSCHISTFCNIPLNENCVSWDQFHSGTDYFFRYPFKKVVLVLMNI